MSQSLRVVFAGTPAFAAAHLKQLIESNHDVVAVYTQPDRPSGRGKQLTPSPVKQLALDHGLSVLQPPTLRNEEATSELADLRRRGRVYLLQVDTGCYKLKAGQKWTHYRPTTNWAHLLHDEVPGTRAEIVLVIASAETVRP